MWVADGLDMVGRMDIHNSLITLEVEVTSCLLEDSSRLQGPLAPIPCDVFIRVSILRIDPPAGWVKRSQHPNQLRHDATRRVTATRRGNGHGGVSFLGVLILPVSEEEVYRFYR